MDTSEEICIGTLGLKTRGSRAGFEFIKTMVCHIRHRICLWDQTCTEYISFLTRKKHFPLNNRDQYSFFIKVVSWASKPDDTLSRAKFGLSSHDLPRSRES